MKNLVNKYLILTCALIVSTIAVTAQDEGSTQNTFLTQTNSLTDVRATASGQGGGTIMRFVNPARQIDGSNYLWDSWKNRGIIVTEDNQQFAIKNVNLNVKRNVFESKIGQDSIFSFNFNNVDRFIVNNKVYKNYYWNDDNRVYQLIYENDDFQFLKGFKINYVEGSANPMLGRKNDRIVKKEYFFIRQEGVIKLFKPSKKRLMKLVEANEQQEEQIKEYVKRNDLSYKRETDIGKILEYASQL